MDENLKNLKKIALIARIITFSSYFVIVLAVILVLIGLTVYKKSFTENPYYFVAIALVILSIIVLYSSNFVLRKKAFITVEKIDVFGNDFVDDLERLFLGPLGCWSRIRLRIKSIYKGIDNLTEEDFKKLEESNENNKKKSKKQNVLLESDRLYVCNFLDDDLEEVYTYRNNVECYKYQSYSCFSKKDLLKMFKLNRQNNLYSQIGNFAIILKENNKLVGELFVSNNTDSREYFIGFTISPDNQRKGYAFEIVSELLVNMATQLLHYSFICTVYEKNIKSVNLIKKLEFKRYSSFFDKKGKVLVYKKTYN